jgi:hypothetical protein
MGFPVLTTDQNTTSPPSLYARLLGVDWAKLDEALRLAHLDGERLCLSGTFRVRRGEGRLARFTATILGLPDSGEAVATRLTVRRTDGGETWTRSFGRSQVITTQSAATDGTMRERFSLIEISCRLEANYNSIRYRQVGAAICLSRLRLLLPRPLWPVVEGVEETHGPNQTRVSVRVIVPIVGHLISYDGTVAREDNVTREGTATREGAA